MSGIAAALAPGAPLVQEGVEVGSRERAEAALAASAHVVDETYLTPAVHQGYVEPPACGAAVDGGGIRLWCTTESPYRVHTQIYVADLGICGDRIVFVGERIVLVEPTRRATAGRSTRPATPSPPPPASSDLPTHTDAQAFWDPSGRRPAGAASTTVDFGNCGFSRGGGR